MLFIILPLACIQCNCAIAPWTV